MRCLVGDIALVRIKRLSKVVGLLAADGGEDEDPDKEEDVEDHIENASDDTEEVHVAELKDTGDKLQEAAEGKNVTNEAELLADVLRIKQKKEGKYTVLTIENGIGENADRENKVTNDEDPVGGSVGDASGEGQTRDRRDAEAHTQQWGGNWEIPQKG